jgi:PAS domain-containing protein
MSAAIKAFDWASTPFGPMENWPACLRFAVSLCESSSHAACILWGPEYRLIYNDVFARGPAARLPNALGVPAYEVFKDIWPTLHPQLEHVVASGQGFTSPEQILPTIRDGVEEEVCWSYSLTPIFGDNDKVLGIFSPGLEITGNILADRRLSFQINLADRLRGLDVPEEMKRVATEQLGQYLGAMRVGYAVISPDGKSLSIQTEWTRDKSVQSLVGRGNLVDIFSPDFMNLLRSQEVVVVPDQQNMTQSTDKQYHELWGNNGIRALIAVPLMRKKTLKALLYVHESEPRAWKRSEIAISQDAAERMESAVERSVAERSLRESEDHYRHTVELNPQIAWTALPDGQVNRISPRWREWTGASGLGDSWLEGLHSEDRERSL